MQARTKLNENSTLAELIKANNQPITLKPMVEYNYFPVYLGLSMSLAVISAAGGWFLSEDWVDKSDSSFSKIVFVVNAMQMLTALHSDAVSPFRQLTPEEVSLLLPTKEALEKFRKNEEFLETKLDKLEKDHKSIANEMPGNAKMKFIRAGLINSSEDCNALKFFCPLRNGLIRLPVTFHLADGQERIYDFLSGMRHIKGMLSNGQTALDPITKIKITGYSISPQLIEKHKNYLLQLERTIGELKNLDAPRMNATPVHENQNTSQRHYRRW